MGRRGPLQGLCFHPSRGAAPDSWLRYSLVFAETAPSLGGTLRLRQEEEAQGREARCCQPRLSPLRRKARGFLGDPAGSIRVQPPLDSKGQGCPWLPQHWARAVSVRMCVSERERARVQSGRWTGNRGHLLATDLETKAVS